MSPGVITLKTSGSRAAVIPGCRSLAVLCMGVHFAFLFLPDMQQERSIGCKCGLGNTIVLSALFCSVNMETLAHRLAIWDQSHVVQNTVETSGKRQALPCIVSAV